MKAKNPKARKYFRIAAIILVGILVVWAIVAAVNGPKEYTYVSGSDIPVDQHGNPPASNSDLPKDVIKDLIREAEQKQSNTN